MKMGTNFYVRLKKNDGEIEEVHIGKRACGWKFLFCDNPKYYLPTKRDLNRFLVLHKNEFYDEYGDLQDPEKFWKESVEAFSDGVDLMENLKNRADNGENVDPWEWEFARTEFYSTGLRFTTEIDFS